MHKYLWKVLLCSVFPIGTIADCPEPGLAQVLYIYILYLCVMKLSESGSYQLWLCLLTL